MKNFEIEDVKKYMLDLLTDSRYDSFCMYEVRLKTSLDYYISGRLNHNFYITDVSEETEDMPDANQEYIYWKDIKKKVFDLIKGKRLPISFRLILMFNQENVIRLIEMNNIPIAPENVGALFYNIYYENGILQVTTGSSVKVFTLDKKLDHLWDDTVEKYYI